MGKPNKRGNKANPRKTKARAITLSPALERIEAFLLEVEALCLQLRDCATALNHAPVTVVRNRPGRFFNMTQRVSKATDFLFRLVDEYKAILNPLMRRKIMYWYKALYAYMEPVQRQIYLQGAWTFQTSPEGGLPEDLPEVPATLDLLPPNPWR